MNINILIINLWWNLLSPLSQLLNLLIFSINKLLLIKKYAYFKSRHVVRLSGNSSAIRMVLQWNGIAIDYWNSIVVPFGWDIKFNGLVLFPKSPIN